MTYTSVASLTMIHRTRSSGCAREVDAEWRHDLQPRRRRNHQTDLLPREILMKIKFVIATSLFLTLSVATLNYSPQTTSASSPGNPFFSESSLPYHAPPFDKIKDTDYAPAIEEGMKDQLAEVEKIANDPAPPTFANTFETLERSGALLTRVTKVFFNLTQSNRSEERRVGKECR